MLTHHDPSASSCHSDLFYYFDYHATTPIDDRVLEEMLPYFRDHFGNASSPHRFGTKAKQGLENARQRVANLIGAHKDEIIFTSGATESNNLALKGIGESCLEEGGHILTTPIEHKAVIEPARYLEKRGFELSFVKVNRYGEVDPDEVDRAIRKNTRIVSIMHANNEVGTLNPIADIAEICRARNVVFHTDAAQSVGHCPIDVKAVPIDMLSLSGHKIYGPKGVGALFVRKDLQKRLCPLVEGGGQEKGIRSGTQSVPEIVGLGKAAELVRETCKTESPRLEKLRDRLWKKLQEAIPGIRLNGHPTNRLPNHLHVSLPCCDAQTLGLYLSEAAFSGGSACQSGKGGSHVLSALGLKPECANNALRLGLGRHSTEEQVDWLADKITSVVQSLSK